MWDFNKALNLEISLRVREGEDTFRRGSQHKQTCSDENMHGLPRGQ